jgi:hypothetical protein
VSITVGKVRGSISRSLRERTVQAFHKLGDHIPPHPPASPRIIEGAACTEAGDQAFRIHLQCMFLMMVSSAPKNEDILKEWLLEELKLDEERSFCVYVRIHSENGNTVTREGRIGYVAKDWKKRHCQICYLRNITEQELADRGTHYQQLHGHNIHAKKTELAPYTYGKQLLTWEQAHLYPINMTIVSAQAVRFMLLSDKSISDGNGPPPIIKWEFQQGRWMFGISRSCSPKDNQTAARWMRCASGNVHTTQCL